MFTPIVPIPDLPGTLGFEPQSPVGTNVTA